MKKILLTAMLVLCTMLASAQTEISETFDLEDHAYLLSLLFDADTFSAEGEALWEPYTYADELLANLSDDGWMHTRLDTLLFYTAFDIERAVAIFETVHYERGVISDCHACGAQISVAIFDKTEHGRWSIERFAKHLTSLGGGGYGGEIGLAQLGENQTCLSLEMSWMGQGVYAEFLSFLNLEDLERVFNLVIHEDNMGVLGEASDRTYSFDRAIQLLPTVETVTGWWEFDLVTQGTQPDNDVERAVPANTVERYAFNWETGTYMKVCP
ncbi:MAG: hypothetical protein Q7T20_03295 [Saprospiraceae bacterium]|nr:hypothetical protein [Saprospiraceae bacterium]